MDNSRITNPGFLTRYVGKEVFTMTDKQIHMLSRFGEVCASAGLTFHEAQGVLLQALEELHMTTLEVPMTECLAKYFDKE